MKVNLDQIEFYHGPSRPPPSTSAKQLSPAFTPQPFQHSSSTGFTFRPSPCGTPLGQEPLLTGTTHQWNIFDVEINNVYDFTRPRTMEDVEPGISADMPAVFDTPLDLGGSPLAVSRPGPLPGSATPVRSPAESDPLDHAPPDIRGKYFLDAVPDTKEADDTELPCVPCVTALSRTPEQASNASSSLSGCDDSQQESTNRKLSITGPCYSDYINSGYCERDTEPHQASDSGENPCSTASDAPECPKDAGTAEGKSATPGPSTQPTEPSSPEHSGARTPPTPDSPVRYSSIAVVVPPPPWKQRAIRTSARAAAAACKKRLRSDQGTGRHQDPDASFPGTEQLGQKRKKQRPAKRPLPKPPGPSISASCHCSSDIQGVRGSALLTVESNSGLKPAYYLTFVPDTSPMQSRPPADIPGKPKPYSSDENALLAEMHRPFKSTIQPNYATRPDLGLEDGDGADERSSWLSTAYLNSLTIEAASLHLRIQKLKIGQHA
ncbi:hypothetical protein CBS147326_8411 [Penicillium roqueforti]|nr:hypothetical protein CBS147326_8411 [Penicillium roqueforti]